MTKKDHIRIAAKVSVIREAMLAGQNYPGGDKKILKAAMLRGDAKAMDNEKGEPMGNIDDIMRMVESSGWGIMTFDRIEPIPKVVVLMDRGDIHRSLGLAISAHEAALSGLWHLIYSDELGPEVEGVTEPFGNVLILADYDFDLPESSRHKVIYHVRHGEKLNRPFLLDDGREILIVDYSSWGVDQDA